MYPRQRIHNVQMAPPSLGKKPGRFAGREAKEEFKQAEERLPKQQASFDNYNQQYQQEAADNRKVAMREQLPGAGTSLGRSQFGQQVGDAVVEALTNPAIQGAGYGSAGLGLTAMALADPLNVYSEGGLFQQDPMAQARFKAARSMELAGTPGVAKAIFEDQINNTLPGGGAFIRDADADPTELQLPRDSDYPGMGMGMAGSGYAMGAHSPGINVQAMVDQRTADLMSQTYQTADGTPARMSFPTANSRAIEEINLELRANGII